jgi:GT2 family glycosyltransferase
VNEAAPTAPPVVAVVVTHDPGAWFDDVVDGLAAQDYPNLRVLVLDTGTAGDVSQRIGERLPGAFVRPLPDPGGFGAAVNEALRLVEGSGFFCLLHDDVALEPTAIRLLVEETYRSNAGIVGPKFVQWDHPDHLLEVGNAADKFATPAPLVDAGELDQEQADAVRDVFFLPSACLLLRVDLFRHLGAFDEAMPFIGDDLDLCWRAHVAGARVLVVPAARARHREAAAERDLHLDRARLGARHRLRSVLSNYSPSHLLRVVPQHLLLTVVLVLGGLVTGRPHTAAAELGAWPWNLARIGQLHAKRKQVKQTRLVPDREVRTLQVHGSARLSAFFRARRGDGERLTAVGAAGRNLAASFRGGAPRSSIVVWLALIVLFLIGSRSLITDGVAAIGTLLPFPSQASDLLRDYFTSWNTHGLGSSAPLPTGGAIVGLGGFLALGQMAFLRTLLVVGPILLGYLGAWRLARPFASQRARLAAVLVYAAIPLGYNSIANGHWAGVLAYAAMPWVIASLARIGGLPPFATRNGTPRAVVARVAGLALLTALVTAFIPLFPVVVIVTAVGLLLGSLAGGGLSGALRSVGGAVVAALLALVVLNLPWGWSLPGSGNWPTLASIPIPGGEQLGLGDLLSFSTGPVRTGWLGWAFALVLVVALLLGKGWRLSWACRAAGVAVLTMVLAWLSDRGSLPFTLPDIEVVLAPAAAALALAGAAGGAAVDQDVAGTRLSWRQPLGSLVAVALAVALLPTLAALPDGRWKLPETDFNDSLAFLPTERAQGDFRVLWLGDPRTLPGTPWKLTDGLGYALSRNGAPDVRDLWALEPTRAEQLVSQAVTLAADGQTARLGRLLGPMSIRYVVVPSEEAPASERTAQHPPPQSLMTALASQLDLEAIELDDALVVYENTTWIPERAQLSPGAAAAAGQAGFDTLVRADLSGTTAVLPADDPRHAEGDVGPGTVFVGQGTSDRWHLEVDGNRATRSPAFGWANAFEVPAGGKGSLQFESSPFRWVLVAVQAAAWILLALVVVRGGRELGRRRAARPTAAMDVPVLIDLGDEAKAPEPALVGSAAATAAGTRLEPPTTTSAAPEQAPTPSTPPGAAPEEAEEETVRWGVADGADDDDEERGR